MWAIPPTPPTAAATSGSACFVRVHHGRLAVLVRHRADELEDLAARLRVEVPGRLFGEDDRRAGDERARDRDALLLAARELRRAVAAAVVQPGPLEKIV